MGMPDQIAPERIHVHAASADPVSKGRYVLYWMQQAQRSACNHALEFAIAQANRLNLPVMALFGLTDAYPEANWRHYAFMLEGLQDAYQDLRDRGIGLQVKIGPPDQVALQAARQAAMMVCDKGYLRQQRCWRQNVVQAAACPVIEVDSDVIVPVTAASGKAEYAARTIRPKIQRLLPRFLTPLRPVLLKVKDLDLAETFDVQKLLSTLSIDRSIGPVSPFLVGGYTRARHRLKFFMDHHLQHYEIARNRPHEDGGTLLSPYLHFGQISSLEIALAIQDADAPPAAKAAILEELIVRRELAVNYVSHCADYDRYAGLPQWARTSLEQHRSDPRIPAYSAKTLERADTHDPYWNAAMLEMKHTGYMHNYMRMYWGKKILQWMKTPQAAFTAMLRWNNAYFLDGRDPNSYAGVGWIFGLHDRPWKERPIFGKIRYMARAGLERKFDMQGYVRKVNHRIDALHAGRTDFPG
jgi:deoxyribodipyrimidine photo-lyase